MEELATVDSTELATPPIASRLAAVPLNTLYVAVTLLASSSYTGLPEKARSAWWGEYSCDPEQWPMMCKTCISLLSATESCFWNPHRPDQCEHIHGVKMMQAFPVMAPYHPSTGLKGDTLQCGQT